VDSNTSNQINLHKLYNSLRKIHHYKIPEIIPNFNDNLILNRVSVLIEACLPHNVRIRLYALRNVPFYDYYAEHCLHKILTV